MTTHGVIVSLKAEIHELRGNNEYNANIIDQLDRLLFYNGTLNECKEFLQKLKQESGQWSSTEDRKS